MDQREFILKVNDWLEALKVDILADGEYKHEDFESGEYPDIEYFEVDIHDVIGEFDDYTITSSLIRDWLPVELIQASDADILDECRLDETPDLGYMFRVATTDAFRLHLQCEFMNKYCKS